MAMRCPIASLPIEPACKVLGKDGGSCVISQSTTERIFSSLFGNLIAI